MDYITSEVHGAAPHDPDEPGRQALAVVTEGLLNAANFPTGLGEPLSDVAYLLVILTENGGDLADVIQHLQAFAAPASAYIPPAAQFSALAAAILGLHRRTRDASAASA
jgi:hypothetical protein